MRYAIALALMLPISTVLADELTVEPEAPQVEQGRVVYLVAKTPGKVVEWVFKDDGLVLLKPPGGAGDSKVAGINAAANTPPGKYRVLVLTAIGDKPVWVEATITVVGEVKPAPPKPNPVPPPPPVIDELPKRLQDAYAAEKSIAKRGVLVNLIGLYGAAGDHAKKPDVTSTRQLLDNVAEVRDELIGKDSTVLRDMRQIISAEVLIALGTPSNVALDDATRARAIAVFQRVASALEKVK